jgi:XTP/dITP diphosphohydrolase
MELLIASTNRGKVREFRHLLPQFEILSLLDFPHYTQPEETGSTFQENALLKARDASTKLQKWTLADDSGLVVPALNGAPGIYSARFAGANASEVENRKKLLQEMKNLTDLGRSAYFECCLALVSPQGQERVFTGQVEGMILEQERGKNGFGYDSLFLKLEYGLTFAEMDEMTKNRISHRGKAIQKLLLVLESSHFNN